MPEDRRADSASISSRDRHPDYRLAIHVRRVRGNAPAEYPPLQIKPATLRARKGIRGGKGIHADELSERADALEAAGLPE